MAETIDVRVWYTINSDDVLTLDMSELAKPVDASIQAMRIDEAQKKRLLAWCQNQLGSKASAELVALINENPSLLSNRAAGTYQAHLSFSSDSNGFNVTVTTDNDQSTNKPSAFFRVEPGRWWGINTRWPTIIENILRWFGLGNKPTVNKETPMRVAEFIVPVSPSHGQDANKAAAQGHSGILAALTVADQTADLNLIVSENKQALASYEEAVNQLGGALVGMENAIGSSEQEFDAACEKVDAAFGLVDQAKQQVKVEDLSADELEGYQQIVHDHESCLDIHDAIITDRHPEQESRIDQEDGLEETSRMSLDNERDSDLEGPAAEDGVSDNEQDDPAAEKDHDASYYR